MVVEMFEGKEVDRDGFLYSGDAASEVCFVIQSHPHPLRLVIEQPNRAVSRKQKALELVQLARPLPPPQRQLHQRQKKSSTYPSGGTPLSSAWAGRACSPQSARAWYHRRGGKPSWNFEACAKTAKEKQRN